MFGALNDNRWRHYAIVYDPSKKGAGIVTLYVDGVAAPVYADNADQGPFALRDDKLYITRRGVSNDRGGAEDGQADGVALFEVRLGGAGDHRLQPDGILGEIDRLGFGLRGLVAGDDCQQGACEISKTFHMH